MYVPKGRKSEECVCTACRKILTPSTAFYYVDGCNFAITASAPPYCRECYREKYGR